MTTTVFASVALVVGGLQAAYDEDGDGDDAAGRVRADAPQTVLRALGASRDAGVPPVLIS